MNGVGEHALRRLVDQKVHVFWHHDVSVDAHRELAPHVFQTLDKQVVDFGGREIRSPVVTTKGEEMGLSGMLETTEPGGHVSEVNVLRLQVQ